MSVQLARLPVSIVLKSNMTCGVFHGLEFACVLYTVRKYYDILPVRGTVLEFTNVLATIFVRYHTLFFFCAVLSTPIIFDTATFIICEKIQPAPSLLFLSII